MSPNVCLSIVGTAVLCLYVAGFLVSVRSPGPPRVGTFLTFTMATVVAVLFALDLHAYATGRAKYELRDNPDGTKTWQRIEVTK